MSAEPFDWPGAVAEAFTDTPAPAVSSWAFLDLEEALAGEYTPRDRTLMCRTDGEGLLYDGEIHSIAGYPGSAKSLTTQWLAAQVIGSGRDVAYIDYESDVRSLVERLRQLGAADDDIRRHFHYARPYVAPDATDADWTAWQALLGQRFTLAVIDGVQQSFDTFHLDPEANKDANAWHRQLPLPIKDRTGATVVQVDHVPKNGDGLARMAIGAQAKQANLTGAGFILDVKEFPGLGKRGTLRLYVTKDRPAELGRLCEEQGRHRGVVGLAAVISVDATGDDGITRFYLDPPGPEDALDTRPTGLMVEVSRLLEQSGEPMSGKAIEDAVTGQARAIRAAVAQLVEDGYIEQSKGSRGAKLHRSVRPFRDPE